MSDSLYPRAVDSVLRRAYPRPGIPGEEWQRDPSASHAGWRYTIDTGKPSGADAEATVDDDIPGIAGTLVAALKGARDWGRTDRAGDELARLADDFGACLDIAEFNELLDELYDFGDEFRVIVK